MGPGDELDQLVHADAAANAPENLVLEKKLKEPLLGTTEGRQLMGHCSGTSMSEGSPEEDINVQSQPEGTIIIKAQPGHAVHCIAASLYVKKYIIIVNFIVVNLSFCASTCVRRIFSFLWLISCIYLIVFEHNQSECVQSTIHLYRIYKNCMYNFIQVLQGFL